MSENLKRREFLTACAGVGGLAAGGITSSAAFQEADTEEPIASARPWWAEQVDEPVLAIDDDVYARFNQHKNVLNAYRDYVSEERAQEVEDKKEAMRADVEAGTMPGYRPRAGRSHRRPHPRRRTSRSEPAHRRRVES